MTDRKPFNHTFFRYKLYFRYRRPFSICRKEWNCNKRQGMNKDKMNLQSKNIKRVNFPKQPFPIDVKTHSKKWRKTNVFSFLSETRNYVDLRHFFLLLLSNLGLVIVFREAHSPKEMFWIKQSWQNLFSRRKLVWIAERKTLK